MTGDFEEARRGLVAPFEPARVEDENGRAVWELESYGFLAEEAPPTAHPDLWRQGRLNSIAKLGELLGLLDEPDPGFAIVTPD